MAASLYAKTYGIEPYEPLEINLNAAPKFLFETNPGDAFFDTLRQHQADAIRAQSKEANALALADKAREAAAIEKIQSLYSQGTPDLNALEQALGESGNVNQAIAMRREALSDARSEKYYDQQDEWMKLNLAKAKRDMMRGALRSAQQGRDIGFFFDPETNTVYPAPTSSKQELMSRNQVPMTNAAAAKMLREQAEKERDEGKDGEKEGPGFWESILPDFGISEKFKGAANSASDALKDSVGSGAVRPGPGAAWGKQEQTLKFRKWRD